MLAATYSRYSSDKQSADSIADQQRICRDLAQRFGFAVAQEFSDPAMSGSNAFRPGYEAMLTAAERGEFQVLLVEALDRLSRDQEDIAHLFKALNFANVRIITHAEGPINELHIGLKGTMNAVHLKDLAQKTHRGMLGRAEAGKSAGGLCFGYRAVHTLRSDGSVTRGDRRIDPAEAAIISRIFEMFADGGSPITIAKTLNGEGITGPNGHAWRDTTIRGHATRGTGILRNELYAGRMVWNRMRFLKDPKTGKRVSRMNPSAQWVTTDVPHLRVIDDGLWQRVQSRLGGIREASGANAADQPKFWEKRRSVHLLTGKLFCGKCGGAFAAVGKDLLACGAARRQGICSNRKGIRRPVLEGLILDALRTQLMTPEDTAVFVAEFTAEWNRQQADASAMVAVKQRELDGVNRKLSGLVDAIADGLRAPGLQQKLDELEARKSILERGMVDTRQPAPRLHPNLAEIYRQKVAELQFALGAPVNGTAVLEATRALIDRVVLHEGDEGEGLVIELIGEIASMVSLALDKPNARQTEEDRGLFVSSVKVVAGTSNRRSHHSTVAI